MSYYDDEYRSKLVSANEAVKIVKSGNWLDWGQCLTNPYALDAALAARKDELEDIKIRLCMSMKSHEIWKVDPNGEIFQWNSWHMGGLDRKQHDKGNTYFIPNLLRNNPLYYRKSLYADSDVAMLRVTPMDKHGYFNFHCSTGLARSICDVAKKIIVEVCPGLPWAYGGGEELVHISEVDYIVEAESPVAEVPPAKATDNDKKIAEIIMGEISDGACIQLGIGGMPNVVGTLLAESDLKELGCHTEMLVDAYYHLWKAGKLTNKRKNINKGKSVYGFALGSKFLYEWIDHNPGLLTYPFDYTNDPAVIAQNDNVISINNCLEVDLYGQISSESSGFRQISGTGGQLDFATGAYLSKGGKSIICCTSSYKDTEGNLQSRIVPTMAPGTIVTVPRNQAHIIVTEYGKCDVAGRSTWERTECIINIAHPDLRDGLVKEAEKMNIWRKSNKR
jgi:butyryl-CoA:acetate CoA-transferase